MLKSSTKPVYDSIRWGYFEMNVKKSVSFVVQQRLRKTVKQEVNSDINVYLVIIGLATRSN
ncbi:hypothetical protein AGMMS50229_05220 [Campylobacterota bacterium]|nr:hypothetical protein AGMMS50229_05220 [Campylobacterota bacterium]